jgi:hypothetical protein
LSVKDGSHYDRRTYYKCLTTKSSAKHLPLRMKKQGIRILHEEKLRDKYGSSNIEMIMIPQ